MDCTFVCESKRDNRYAQLLAASTENTCHGKLTLNHDRITRKGIKCQRRQ
jgi:hypothetical protein